jgi:hypothetical protein
MGTGRINAVFFLTAWLFSFPLGRLSDHADKKNYCYGWSVLPECYRLSGFFLRSVINETE